MPTAVNNVFVARIEHKYGDNEAAFSTKEKATDWVFAYVVQSHEDVSKSYEPETWTVECSALIAGLKKQEAIDFYFERMRELGVEFYNIQKLTVDEDS
jgi:hypothetical protein